MHKLEILREEKDMSKPQFCNWLGISYNSYKKILDGYNIAKTKKDIQQMGVNVFIKINEKTGLGLDDLIPNHPLCKLIKK